MSGRPPLLASLMRRLNRLGRRTKAGAAATPERLLRDEPADWKDAVYSPKGFRRRKRS